jgi:hypothetical protein
MKEERIAALSAYIGKWDNHLNTHFGSQMDVRDKRILVVGSGWGTEVLWLLKNGAREVVGIDPKWDKRQPLERALDNLGLGELAARAELIATTPLLADDLGRFDHIMSNNVLEHVEGLSANLRALARFIPDRGSRFFVFSNPLFYSSHGHHLPIGPWDHLTQRQDEIEARVAAWEWKEYRGGLNGMTITDILSAIREAGLILLNFSTQVDHQLSLLPSLLQQVSPEIRPMDLCLEGFSGILAWPHNI